MLSRVLQFLQAKQLQVGTLHFVAKKTSFKYFSINKQKRFKR